MRVLEASSRIVAPDVTERTESSTLNDVTKSGGNVKGSTEDHVRPSTSSLSSSGQLESTSTFTISSLASTSPSTSQLSMRSEMWPNVSSEALLVSLDEPSESSSAQSSPTTSTAPSTSSSTTCAESSRSSPSASNTTEDPSAVQRRYRYIRSRIPVRGHSFCSCLDSPNRTEGRFLECLCGEENGSICEWTWDSEFKSVAAKVQDDSRTVIFHPNFSNGTAGVRGSAPMKEGQHFWEIKMITPVYGTNMMVGVGTKDINLEGYSNVFCSLLGQSNDSWGLSYQAHFHHAGQIWQYGGMFGQGSLVGIHLDCWNGTLSFYKNRRPLGIACRNLTGKEVFPMLCSTAARSGMRLVRTQSCASTLQYLCCRKIRQTIPAHLDAIQEVPLPPGLKSYLAGAYGWVLSSTTEPTKPPQDEKEENNPQGPEVELDGGSSTADTSSSFQVMADRDIIFERFVERLSSSTQVQAAVHNAAVPGTSRQSTNEAGKAATPSTSAAHFEMVSSSSPNIVVNPAVVTDTENVIDVPILSPQALMMETGQKEVESSSWLRPTGDSQLETSKTRSSKSGAKVDAQGLFLKRTLRRKRTIADLSDISEAAVNLSEKLECSDPDSTDLPKRQKLPDTESCKVSSTMCTTDTEAKPDCTSEAKTSPSTPFSAFFLTSRPFTPPNGTSTPVTNLSPEDLSSSKSSEEDNSSELDNERANHNEDARKDCDDL